MKSLVTAKFIALENFPLYNIQYVHLRSKFMVVKFQAKRYNQLRCAYKVAYYTLEHAMLRISINCAGKK